MSGGSAPRAVGAPEPNCRIGRIRLRNGAEVRVIDTKARPPKAAEYRRLIVDHAQFHAQHWPRMAGYVMLVWDAEASWSMAYRIGPASPVDQADLATFVADRVRAQATANYTVDEIELARCPPPKGS